jgi:hypothetical protein
MLPALQTVWFGSKQDKVKQFSVDVSIQTVKHGTMFVKWCHPNCLA